MWVVYCICYYDDGFAPGAGLCSGESCPTRRCCSHNATIERARVQQLKSFTVSIATDIFLSALRKPMTTLISTYAKTEHFEALLSVECCHGQGQELLLPNETLTKILLQYWNCIKTVIICMGKE
mmetsp:Transcript_25039/g.61685  ORF Transcript_25039/g.61685 Transcript_25039/m.61685 type:complete len:124 (-) Transcript_25039:644-1015(-)